MHIDRSIKSRDILQDLRSGGTRTTGRNSAAGKKDCQKRSGEIKTTRSVGPQLPPQRKLKLRQPRRFILFAVCQRHRLRRVRMSFAFQC